MEMNPFFQTYLSSGLLVTFLSSKTHTHTHTHTHTPPTQYTHLTHRNTIHSTHRHTIYTPHIQTHNTYTSHTDTQHTPHTQTQHTPHVDTPHTHTKHRHTVKHQFLDETEKLEKEKHIARDSFQSKCLIFLRDNLIEDFENI